MTPDLIQHEEWVVDHVRIFGAPDAIALQRVVNPKTRERVAIAGFLSPAGGARPEDIGRAHLAARGPKMLRALRKIAVEGAEMSAGEMREVAEEAILGAIDGSR